MIESPKVEAARDALYGVPLEAFVEERKRLVKDLRTGGDRRAAAEVAKLRKPSAAAWALNRVARDSPHVVDEWLKAAAHLRDASSRPAQVGGEAVRTAIASHRAATSRMLETVRERSQPGGRPVSEDMLDRARTLLQAATADASLAALLQRGSISEEALTEDAVGGVAAGAPPPAAGKPAGEAPARPSRARGKRDPGAAGEAAARARREDAARRRAERAAELGRRIEDGEADVARLAAEHDRHVGVAVEAQKALEAARHALESAESDVRRAQTAVARTERPLRAARAHLAELRAEADAIEA